MTTLVDQAVALYEADLDQAEAQIMQRWREMLASDKLDPLPGNEKEIKAGGDDDRPLWVWNAKARRYFDIRSGRFVGHAEMVRTRDEFLDRQKLRTTRLAQQLVDGDITIQDWLLAQREAIKETYLAMYGMARGGRHQMTPQDYGRVGADLKKQYGQGGFLQRFAEQIRNGYYAGRDPANIAARIADRAGMYIDSANQAFEKGKLATYGPELQARMTHIPGDGQTPCLTNCRCHTSIDDRGDVYHVRWILDPAAKHCTTSDNSRPGCLELAQMWNPLVVPKAAMGKAYFLFNTKANPHHDGQGRFTSKDQGGGVVNLGIADSVSALGLSPDHEVVKFLGDRGELGRQTLQLMAGLASYSDAGIEASPQSVTLESYGVRLKGTFEKDGKKVGEFDRVFDPVNGVIDNRHFAVHPTERGTGVGGRFYKASEDAYKEAGYKQVELLANEDVGGYAWARAGYDFKDEGARTEIVVGFAAEYNARYGSDLPVVPRTPWEIAAYKGPDGERIGKDYMLDTSWAGVKMLDDADPGYQVGRAYYEAKRDKPTKAYTLVDMVDVKIGTDTSGNWGHKGWKGKVGGSAPGGGHAAIGIKPGAGREEKVAATKKRRGSQPPGNQQKASVYSVPKVFDLDWEYKDLYDHGGELEKYRDEIERYTDSGYSVNYYLRNSLPHLLDDSEKAVIETLDAAMNAAPRISQGTKTFRYMPPSVMEGLSVGDELHDKGFVSTTITQGLPGVSTGTASVGGRFEMAVLVPKGSRALWARPVSRHKSENELILPRDSRFVVLEKSDKSATVMLVN